jgi:hypothetical protein
METNPVKDLILTKKEGKRKHKIDKKAAEAA